MGIVKEPTQADFRLLADISVDVIYQLNLEGDLTYCSPSVERMLGYTPEEVIGNNFSKFLSPTDISIATEAFQEVISGSIVENFEFQLLKKNQSFVPVEFSAIPVFSNGEINSVQGICRNISERKQVANEILSLKESELRNRQIIENIREIIFTLSAEGNITSLNPAFEKITGWSPNEFLDKPFTTMMHHDDIPGTLRAFDSISRGERPSTSEVRLKTKTGAYSFIEGKVTPQFEQGKIIGYFGIARDITERKQALEALRDSEEKFRLLSEQSFMAICLIQDHRVKYVNQAFVNLVGFSYEEVLSWTSTEYLRYVHPDDLAFVKEQGLKKQTGVTNGVVPHYSFRFITQTGDIRWVEVFSKTIESQGRPADFITFIDITERKQTEEKLLESEAQNRYILENIRDVIFTLLPDGTIASVSPEFEKITGWTRAEWIGRPFVEIVIPEDIPITTEGFEATISGEPPPPYEGRIKSKTGEILTFEVKATPQIEDGKIIAYLGTARDITLRKKTEERLRAFMESSPDYSALLDPELNYIEVNKAGLKVLRETKENVIGKNILELDPLLTETGRYNEYLEVIRTGKPLFIKDLVPRPKFGDLHISLRAFKVGDGLGVIATDITELKQTEEALRDKEERLRSFMDAATDSFTLWDSELNLVDIDKTGLKRFFKDESRDIIIGRNILDFAGRSSYIEIYKDVLKTGNPFSGERPAPPSLFGNLILSVKAFKVGDGLGIITTDITKRKEMEDELRENEEKFRSIFENAPIGMALTDLDFRFSKTNMVFCQMLGYSTHELAELSFPDITHPDYHRKDVEYNKKLERDEISTYQTDKRYLMKDGKLFWGRTTVSLLRDDKGAPSYYLAMIEDITALKQKEEELKSQLLKYNLIDGNVYLIKENIPALSQTVFVDLLKVGYRGFVISRTPEREHRQGIEGDFDILHLNEKSNSEEIHKFIENAPHKSVFLIDRLEYLFITKGFDNAIQLLYKWSDIAYLNNLIILLSVDVSTFKEEEISVLEKETKRIEPKFMTKVSEEFLQLLRFIYQQNNLGMKPSYSDIRVELKTSRPTVRKRIKRLATTGYLIESKKGNKKVLEITEKGRSLFQS